MQRRRKSRLQRMSGQVLAIFAIIAGLLFAVVGLAVDAGISYLTDNQAERAAAAAALAGVPYMPSGWGSTADAAAKAAAARNSFADGGTKNGHPVTVAVARYPAGCGGSGPACDSNKLTVTVTAWAQTTFLRMVGFGDHQLSVSATAFYLAPISLGQPGSQLGSSEDALGSSNNYYFLRSEGYGNDRSEGDAYTPNGTNQTYGTGNGCDVSMTTAGYGTSTDSHSLSSNGGTDLTTLGAGFNPVPTRGGFDYAITIPSTVSAGYVRVYNPSFAPDGGYNPYPNAGTSSNYNMHEQDGSFSGNGSRSQYSVMEYTIFKVVDIFDHTQDVPLSQILVDPLNADPSNNTWSDVRLNKSITGTGATTLVNSVYHNWVDVGNPSVTTWGSGSSTSTFITVNKALSSSGLAPGNYRLRVDMLDYQGLRPVDDSGAVPCSRAHKGYAVQVSTKSGSTYSACSVSGCTMSAINEMGIYTPIVSSGGSFSMPVFQLPMDYRGKTVNFYIFDPGDVSGSNTISLINPDTSAVLTADTGASINVYDLGVSRNVAPTPAMLVNTLHPGSQPDTTKASVQTVVGGSNVYNSHWLLFELQIPAGYNGGSGSYWTLQYTVNGQAGDTVTIAVNYNGAAVHLIN
jgi:Flp pilus assembly protein TadG